VRVLRGCDVVWCVEGWWCYAVPLDEAVLCFGGCGLAGIETEDAVSRFCWMTLMSRIDR